MAPSHHLRGMFPTKSAILAKAIMSLRTDAIPIVLSQKVFTAMREDVFVPKAGVEMV